MQYNIIGIIGVEKLYDSWQQKAWQNLTGFCNQKS